ncbi:MAG: c-type cytochrome [Pedobacter sp.]|nr:MAG: c-type cytochrome [Pedobacter sp.]
MLSLIFLGLGAFAQAEEVVAPTAPASSFGLSTTEVLIIALLLFAVVLLIVSITLFNAFKIMLKEKANPQPFVKYQAEPLLDYDEWLKQNKTKPNIWTKLLSLKPIEEEKSLEIPHAYDGIKELNNPIPAWFNVLFYGTLVFAAGYLYYYHIGEYGERQDDEYATEIAKADIAKRAFLAKSTTNFDENTVKIDPAQAANGKMVFDANCIACHGEKGEGLVGPNLTDEFWLHGGSVSDVFKVVKYGVPAKGMVSWEKNLSPQKISEVTNYILSLQGTNPANSKAPQGEKYEAKSAEGTVANDTTATK